MDSRVKAIIETVKATAAVAGEAAASVAKEVGKRAGDTVEVTKLNMKIFDLNSETAVLLKKLGTAVYAAHTGADANEEEIDSVISELDSLNAEIDSLKDRVAEYKNLVKCPSCGAECSKKDSFCKKCGASLK